MSCVSLAACFWPPQLQARPAQVLFEILTSWRSPWGALRQSGDLPFAPAWIWGAFPGQLHLICQRAAKGCCIGQTCSWEKQVAYIKVSSILNDSVIFLTGCFSCNMLYISLLTCLVRNHSAFFWCAQWACRSAGIEGNCWKAKCGEAMGNHPVFPFHSGMSDVRGHMLRCCQLSNVQLGLQLPQGITHPEPLATEDIWAGKPGDQPSVWINNSSRILN